MTTLSEMKDSIRLILKDSAETKFDDDLMNDAINEGHIAILDWHAKRSQQDFLGDGTTNTFTLPTDLHDIDGVLLIKSNGSAKFLQQGLIIAGNVWDTTFIETNWMEYPTGTLELSEAPESGETIRLFYRAHWTKLISDSDTLEIAKHYEVGVKLYAASYALIPNAVSAGEIRQFNTRVDSGNPEHNPAQELSNWLLRRFEAEMDRHPSQQKGILAT